jgi:hypothetical protein
MLGDVGRVDGLMDGNVLSGKPLILIFPSHSQCGSKFGIPANIVSKLKFGLPSKTSLDNLVFASN